MEDRREDAEPLPARCLAVTTLRSARRWRQGRLARAAGISRNVINNYERGLTTPSRAQLVALAAVLGYDEADVDWLLFSFDGLPADAADPSPVGPTPEERRIIRATATAAARATLALTRLGLDRMVRRSRARRDRREAAASWTRLRTFPAATRRILVAGAREYQTWAVCELICAETLRETPKDTAKAIELAELALLAATKMRGGAAWRAWVNAYAWAHVGNARRVANDHAGADAAFARSRELREAGRSAAEPDLLDEGRMLDLEASLRRDERRFEEALELHERALAVSWTENKVYVLLNRAFTLEQAERYEEAVVTLAEAEQLLDGNRHPRLLFGARFNSVVNCCHLERYREADALLPGVREMAIRLGNDLDLLRTLWLSGRIHAGLGRRKEAVATLEQVKGDFLARKLPFGMALASLELAALYLEEGRMAEVKALAEQMLVIFLAQKTHREALAAIRLFHRAATAEAATAELARRIGRYLERARLDPTLPFAA